MPRVPVVLATLAVLAATGCATGVYGIRPGESRLPDVERSLGSPALRWTESGGIQAFAYPTGPMGLVTHIVRADAGGVVRSIENALTEAHFARIRPGMTREQVLHLIGPPEPQWTRHYPARNELAWEWRYCDLWLAASRLDVLFDATAGTVRTVQSRREVCGETACGCFPDRTQRVSIP